jgi:hypothetical protein
MLFILPGILSDLLAIALLCCRSIWAAALRQSAGTDSGDPLDGDYRRID